ncbi:MAG: 30S ribosomal protein S2 [Salinivirgaceae bacterium]
MAHDSKSKTPPDNEERDNPAAETVAKLDEATNAIKQIAKSGRKILFVATKKQAKDIVAEKVKATGMPYVTERWSGGMLTNFPTIRRAIKRMNSLDSMEKDGTLSHLSKRERLQVNRQKIKMERNLGSIADLNRLPAAMFVVDVQKEHIAVAEARRLNIPVFAIVDTNSNPNLVDYAIPANDDAAKSIAVILDAITGAIKDGLGERKVERDKDGGASEKKGAKKSDAKAKKTSARKAPAKVAAEAKDTAKDTAENKSQENTSDKE